MSSLKVGRSSSNDIILPDSTVSSNHALLTIDDHGQLWIEDLGSKNGTFVNGGRISRRTQLRIGDRVLLGKYAWSWERDIRSSPRRKENVRTGNQYEDSGAYEPIRSPKTSYTLPIAIGSAVLIVVLMVFNWHHVRAVLHKSGLSKSGSPQTQVVKEIEYDPSCIQDSSFVEQGIKFGDDAQNTIVGIFGGEVTKEEEIEVGDQCHEQLKDEHKLMQSGIEYDRLYKVYKTLIKNISSPRFQYKLYVIESDDINAFTAGGRIYFYTGIINFVDSDDELACVLAHEINHNELGHIAAKIKKHKAAKNVLGDAAFIPILGDQLFGQAFNQDEEVMCDFHGVDLAIKSGYDGCAAASFWKRAAAKEKENEFEKLFRSHPFSVQREACVKNHIKHNYDYTCD